MLQLDSHGRVDPGKADISAAPRNFVLHSRWDGAFCDCQLAAWRCQVLAHTIAGYGDGWFGFSSDQALHRLRPVLELRHEKQVNYDSDQDT
jgi:hypothetical protein